MEAHRSSSPKKTDALAPGTQPSGPSRELHFVYTHHMTNVKQHGSMRPFGSVCARAHITLQLSGRCACVCHALCTVALTPVALMSPRLLGERVRPAFSISLSIRSELAPVRVSHGKKWPQRGPSSRPRQLRHWGRRGQHYRPPPFALDERENAL